MWTQLATVTLKSQFIIFKIDLMILSIYKKMQETIWHSEVTVRLN